MTTNDPEDKEFSVFDAALVYEGPDLIREALRKAVHPKTAHRVVPSALTPKMLRTMPNPEPPLLEGVLSRGLNLLVSRPKVGKTWACLQFARAVAYGGPIFGQEPTLHGRVLYVSLEDGAARVKSRIDRQGWPDGDAVEFVFDLTPWDEGGRDELIAAIRKCRPVLAIIDPLNRILGNRDINTMGEMTELLGPLQNLATETGTTFLITYHTRKTQGGGDPDVDMLGSTAIAAVPDTLIGIFRQTHGYGFVVKSRDMEGDDFLATFASDAGIWELADPLASEPNTAALIMVALHDLHSATAEEIAERVGKERTTVFKILRRLLEQAYVTKTRVGRQDYYSIRRD